MLTNTDADRYMAAGALTLRELAALWSVPMSDAYQRLYGRPMPAPASFPTRQSRAYWHTRRRSVYRRHA